MACRIKKNLALVLFPAAASLINLVLHRQSSRYKINVVPEVIDFIIETSVWGKEN